MFCSKCGKAVSEEAKFCPSCGKSISGLMVDASAQPKNSPVKLVAGVLSGLLIAFAVAAALGVFHHEPEIPVEAGTVSNETVTNAIEGTESIEETVEAVTTIEGSGFDSPEEAIVAYLKAMQDGDINRMLSTFAIESYVDNYDLIAAIVRSGTYSTSYTQPLPPVDEYTRSINIYKRESILVQTFLGQYYYFADMMDYYYEIMGAKDSFGYGSPENFFDALQNEDWMDTLADMKYGDVMTAEDLKHILPENYFSESAHDLIDSRMNELGSDDYVSLAIDVELGGKEYYLCLDVICYDGRWFNYGYGIIAQFLGCDPIAGGFIER